LFLICAGELIVLELPENIRGLEVISEGEEGR
jgi:hypothetical protein